MFRNPFVDLGKPRLDADGEEVEGAFSCQVIGCYEVARDAKFYPTTKLLVWTCKDGHDSKIEGFEIDW
jgi:hypothetical protein